MQEKYYTVEQISNMIDMHPKTIQRYIREGKLRAKKIGKSWRISGHDLSVFAESTSNLSFEPKTPSTDKVIASSVIDIKVDDFDECTRIINMLMAAFNCKPHEYGKSTMYAQHLEHENKVRVSIWGNIRFIGEIIEMITVLTEQ